MTSRCGWLAGAVALFAAASVRGQDEIFYRAYFVEQGLEQADAALPLYREYLRLAPDTPLAGQAARQAIAILERSGASDEAAQLRAAHAGILAETTPAGINAEYVDAHADVARLVARFEAESREVYAFRRDLVALVAARPGQAVADIGAGTGVFTNLLARQVGDRGVVYAVEIGPRLVDHLRELGTAMQLPQVRAVLCTETSTELPADSIDVAFVCDTYHHFTQPRETLASLHRALRDNGQLLVVEFARVVGVSRPWVLDHVRAGAEVFRAEIEAAGFRFVREEKTPFLRESYLLRFARQ